MNTFRLKISSPDGNLFDGEAERITVRGIEGELAIMAGHVPFITTLAPGECRIETADGVFKSGRAESGFLIVSKEEVTLLSGTFRFG